MYLWSDEYDQTTSAVFELGGRSSQAILPLVCFWASAVSGLAFFGGWTRENIEAVILLTSINTRGKLLSHFVPCCSQVIMPRELINLARVPRLLVLTSQASDLRAALGENAFLILFYNRAHEHRKAE